MRFGYRHYIERLTHGLPKPWRIAIDWLVTILGAILIVLAIKQWVVNPYRIPSSSMEPTLHCARPGLGCEASFSDRVLACRFCFDIWSPKRGDVIVFKTPPQAAISCGAGGTFVKRLIGLPGDTVYEDNHGFIWINGKRLSEPYIEAARRQEDVRNADYRRQAVGGSEGPILLHGRQPRPVLRLATMGSGSAREPDRQGGRHVLATLADFDPVTRRARPAVERTCHRVGTDATRSPALPFLCPLGRVGGQRVVGSRAGPGSSATMQPPAGPSAMSTTIQEIERRQLRDVPRFKAGDSVRVHFRVIEGNRQRIQVFEGVVLRRQGAGVRETFTVRKNSFGVGVERTFPLHSPKIDKIEVTAIGDVNRAKLYYLRGRVGKKARIRELRQS